MMPFSRSEGLTPALPTASLAGGPSVRLAVTSISCGRARARRGRRRLRQRVGEARWRLAGGGVGLLAPRVRCESERGAGRVRGGC